MPAADFRFKGWTPRNETPKHIQFDHLTIFNVLACTCLEVRGRRCSSKLHAEAPQLSAKISNFFANSEHCTRISTTIIIRIYVTWRPLSFSGTRSLVVSNLFPNTLYALEQHLSSHNSHLSDHPLAISQHNNAR